MLKKEGRKGRKDERKQILPTQQTRKGTSKESEGEKKKA